MLLRALLAAVALLAVGARAIDAPLAAVSTPVRTLLAADSLFCGATKEGSTLVGGALVKTVAIPTEGSKLGDIVGKCCAACKKAASKGCRRYAVVFTNRSSTADCELRSAGAKVARCGADCKYDNGAKGAKENFQTGQLAKELSGGMLR